MKETLEEAAASYGNIDYPIPYGYVGSANDFFNGAKWQEERMYSEEDLKTAYFSAIKSTGEGWNGEYAQGNNPNIEETFEEEFNQWFEQFKNK
jgi:hypothetical protein